MRRLAYLASARRDLSDILEYITEERGTLVIGRRFVEVLRAQCRRLALPGTLGRVRPCGLISEAFPSKATSFFSGTVPTLSKVVNVLEGQRDITGWFRDDSDHGV